MQSVVLRIALLRAPFLITSLDEKTEVIPDLFSIFETTLDTQVGELPGR